MKDNLKLINDCEIKAGEYLKKVDDIIYKKENEIDKLNNQINELNSKLKKQKEDLDDMSKEKEDLQNSVSTLSTQVEEQKNLSIVNLKASSNILGTNFSITGEEIPNPGLLLISNIQGLKFLSTMKS